MNSQAPTSNPGPPRVSFIIFGYNQEALVDAAIAGAFAQDYGNLEIILSDDCSQDKTHARMEAAANAYRGGHKVLVNKTPGNRGTFAHAHHAVGRSTGDLVIMAAADDVSYPWRTASLVRAWQETGACALFSKYDLINQAGSVVQRGYKFDGSSLEYHDYFPNRLLLPIHGASSAYAREVFDLFALPDRPVLFEDTFLSLGLTLLGRSTVFVDEALVQYRLHGQSQTNASEVGVEYDAILSRERRGETLANSMATVLEEIKALALRTQMTGDIAMSKLEQDLHFYRHRSNWISLGSLRRLRASLSARRWAHARWLLARMAGVRGLAAAKALRLKLRGGVWAGAGSSSR